MKLLLATTLTAATLGAGCNGVFGIKEAEPWLRCEGLLMIDDMEDHDGAICETKDQVGRHGEWYTTSDGTSSNLQPAPGQPFVPARIPGGRGDSLYAARLTGSGFTGWGALMGFNLNVKGLAPDVYDASTIGGIKFWMKSNVPVTVRVQMKETIPVGRGGKCSDSATAQNCDNPFAFAISAPPPDQWIEYEVPFLALAQAAKNDAQGNVVFGSLAWSPAALIGIEFSVPQLLTAAELAFDVWVDDIRFYGCKGADCRPTCTDPALPVACPSSGTTAAGCWPAGSDCAAVSVLADGFQGVWGSAANDVWAVGSSTSTGAGVVARWNGVAWSIVTGEAKKSLQAVWGSGRDDVWAVGDWGTTLHWKGTAWTAEASNTTESLQAVWGSGLDDVWAVGHAGTILHWNGSAWSIAASPTTDWLTNVWGNGPDDVWAVGVSLTDPSGVIIHWNGSRWAIVPNGAPQVLVGVWSSGTDDAWAVGYGAVHWNGSAWAAVASPIDPTQSILIAVWGSGPNDVWAVGGLGTTLHWNGGMWSSVPSGTTQDLYRLWGSGANDVWAVGVRGTFIHWTGAAWSVVPPSAIQIR